MEGGSASFGCDLRGICNTFSVLWFKQTIKGSIRTNGVSQTDSLRHSDKYYIITSGSQAVANGHCNIGTTLIIYRFNHSDNGYYWCQIVSNNSCLLRPSPHAYVAVGETMNEHSCTFEHQLPRPICAENATLLKDSEMGCISSSSVIVMMPTPILHYTVHFYNSTTATTTLHNNKEFTRKDNMTWLYGLMTVFLLAIIILVLTVAIVSVKCRTLQNRSKLNVYRYAVCIMHACIYILL